MHFTTEFDQLAQSLIWAASDGSDMVIDPDSRKRLQVEYESFCEILPEEFDPEDSCLTWGDPYEQFAHDYVLTRMHAGVGYWETSDWEKETGEHLTNLCRLQGTLLTYQVDNVLYIY